MGSRSVELDKSGWDVLSNLRLEQKIFLRSSSSCVYWSRNNLLRYLRLSRKLLICAHQTCWFESFEAKKKLYSLKTFLCIATAFTITQCSYVRFPSHLPNNDSLVDCLLFLFVAELNSRAISIEDRQPLIGNEWDHTSGHVPMNCCGCNYGVSLIKYAECIHCENKTKIFYLDLFGIVTSRCIFINHGDYNWDFGESDNGSIIKVTFLLLLTI